MVVLQVDFHVLLEWTETNGCLEGGKCSNATSFIVNGLKNLLGNTVLLCGSSWYLTWRH